VSIFIKRFLLSALLALLLLPALQARFPYFKEIELHGAFTIAPHPTLSWQALRDNAFQPALEQYLEDRIGFRSYLIKVHNQLSFSLFRASRSGDVIVGRHDVLFQTKPIASYRGADRLTDAEVRFRVRRLRALQDTLGHLGVPFLFVMAPNKARYQPEDLPDYYQSMLAKSNYELFMQEMHAQGLNLLDAVKLFQAWKDTTQHPLFPKGGTHWSGYGAALFADTLFPRMESMARFDLIDFHRKGPVTVLRDSLRYTDTDLTGTLNLLSSYKQYPTAYPTVVFDTLKANQRRPNLLLIGDSFNWALMQFWPYMQTLFAPESRIWGQDRNIFVYADNYTHDTRDFWQLDLRQELKSRDFIVMLMTEHNLDQHSLIDQLYELFYPVPEATRNRVKEIEKALSSFPEIQQRLWDEAYQGNHQLADELHNNALAQYEKELIAEDQRQHGETK
jgi:hypothetical protein